MTYPRQRNLRRSIHKNRATSWVEPHTFPPYFAWKEKDWIDFRNVLKVWEHLFSKKKIHKPSTNTKHNRSRTEKFLWHKIDLNCPMYCWSQKAARQLAEEAHAAPNSCALHNNRSQGKWTRKRWMWNQSRSNISWAEQKASLASSFPRSYPREPRPHRSAALILIATAIQTFVHCLCLCSRHFCFFSFNGQTFLILL